MKRLEILDCIVGRLIAEGLRYASELTDKKIIEKLKDTVASTKLIKIAIDDKMELKMRFNNMVIINN